MRLCCKVTTTILTAALLFSVLADGRHCYSGFGSFNPYVNPTGHKDCATLQTGTLRRETLSAIISVLSFKVDFSELDIRSLYNSWSN